MISYIVGNPGSGKTYYAVFEIYQLFLFKPNNTFLSKFIKPEKQKTYDYCYTNINEFKFDLSNKFIKFDFDKFYSDMETLHALYLDDVTDDEINEKAKELKLHNVFVVLDECHNFLKDKENPVLVWWLTYHRHLYQDIMLITQDLTLVNNEYKRIAEYFIKAVDSSKRLFKNKFRYMLYGSYKMYQKDIMQKFNIPYLKEVFNLYHSGQITSQNSFVRRFLYFSLFLFIALSIYFYFFISSFRNDSDPVQPLESHESSQQPRSYQPSPQQKQPKLDSISQSTYIYNLICINEICHFINQKYTFPFSYVSFIISSSKPLYFYPVTKNSHFTEYFLVFDTPALDDLVQTSNKFNKKDVSNESFKTTDTSPTLFK